MASQKKQGEVNIYDFQWVLFISEITTNFSSLVGTAEKYIDNSYMKKIMPLNSEYILYRFVKIGAFWWSL